MRPMGVVRRFSLWSSSFVFGAASAMMGVAPEQAATNLAKWYALVAPPPQWLATPSVYYDLTMWAFAFLSLVLLLWAAARTFDWRWASKVPANASGSTYLAVWDVARYLAEQSEWGANRLAQGRSPSLVLLDAFSEFDARAAEGRIRVYGAHPQTHEHQEIPKTHWMSYGLDPSSDDQEGGRSEPKTAWGGYLGRHGYTELRIVAEDVYRTWPRKP